MAVGMSTYACDKSSQPCLNEEKREAFEVSFFHHDNAKPYRAWITSECLLENHVEQSQNPRYSPGLSSCDFFLFPKLKKQLRGVQFNDDNEMLAAVEQAIDSLTKEDFKIYLEDWFIRMHRCIDAEGQYFEKIN